MVTRAVDTGFELEWIVDLDLISFDALNLSVQRTYYRKALDTITWARVAQAEGNDYKKILRTLEKAASVSGTSSLENTGDTLISKFGRGF